MSALGPKPARKPTSATRVAVLDTVRRSEKPITVHEIAAKLDLHTNSVRFHLSRLLQSGQLHEEQAVPDGPGRPRMVYTALPVPDWQPEPGAASGAPGTTTPEPVPARASATGPTPAAATPPEGSGYQFLTEMLAGHLAATSADPGAAASAVGEAWGRYLSDRPVPFSHTTEEQSVAQITEVLERTGFSPVRSGEGGRRLDLHVCPFRTVADHQPGVVCAIHLGLVRGALSETNAQIQITRLDRFTAPHACIAQLRPVGTADGDTDDGRTEGDDVENLPGWAGRITG